MEALLCSSPYKNKWGQHFAKGLLITKYNIFPDMCCHADKMGMGSIQFMFLKVSKKQFKPQQQHVFPDTLHQPQCGQLFSLELFSTEEVVPNKMMGLLDGNVGQPIPIGQSPTLVQIEIFL